MSPENPQWPIPPSELSKGATEESIARAAQECGFSFPEDYRAFLRCSDGLVGSFLADNYVVLWRACELGQFNQEYEFPVYCPGVVAIGSTGAGEAFAFRRDDASVVLVPFIGMRMEHCLFIAPTFTELLSFPRPPNWRNRRDDKA